MTFFTFIVLAIGFLFVVGVPVLIYIHQRIYIDPLKRSIEWQLTKAQKISEGWLPPAYTDFANDEERDAAILDLLSDDGGRRK